MRTTSLDKNCGWVDDQKKVESVMSQLPHPVFGDIWGDIKNSGAGKSLLLYDVVRSLNNKVYPNRKQETGDCVSTGGANAIDVTKSCDIIVKKQFEEWVAETASEDLYAGSRVQIGKGRISGNGSIGAWLAQYVNLYGALPRGKYGNVDLTTYSGQRAVLWGAASRGVPQSLIPYAKEHPIATVSRVDSYEQARDLLANGYGIFICSNQGFSATRDKDGFSAPSGIWYHCMCANALDDKFRRPGLCIQNTWGTWNSGPKRHNQPDGSFWVDADVINKMLKQGDSWALSGYEGFKPRKINTRIF